MKWIKFFIMVLTIPVYQSCNSCRDQTDVTGPVTIEENYSARMDITKRIENERFGFVFRIPVSWQASDLSDNGDGYILLPPKNIGDIRIYAETIAETREPVFTCSSRSDFRFDDGAKGVMCQNSGNEYFIYRQDEIKRLVFTENCRII
ncbi:MAG: hypothetical protein HC906_15595 [Bacteroidales bacterium]|nr:hypothetical protein [Bacteroidales bacterium]